MQVLPNLKALRIHRNIPMLFLILKSGPPKEAISYTRLKDFYT